MNSWTETSVNIIQVAANIIQVIGVLWVVLLGSKTIFDIIKLPQQKEIPVDKLLPRASKYFPYVGNFITIAILFLLLANSFYSPKYIIVTPTPTPTPPTSFVDPLSCFHGAFSQTFSISSRPHQDTYRTTTGKCLNIHLKFDTALPHRVKVQACFPTMIPHPWCGAPPDNQNVWVTFDTQGVWKDVAEDMKAGSTFYLIFKLADTSAASLSVKADMAY